MLLPPPPRITAITGVDLHEDGRVLILVQIDPSSEIPAIRQRATAVSHPAWLTIADPVDERSIGLITPAEKTTEA